TGPPCLARTLPPGTYRASSCKPLLLSEPMGGGRAAIVLAAGASRRMGTPKALLAWRGTTLLDYCISQARLASVSDLVVVLGPATQHLTLETTTVVNPDPETGRSTSIRR